ncbi:MAG TPA: hypothetical protein P5567_03050 [Kiritimatiellia bacterium]|nr:hypothetical protein [Kiritimatiellia bacterium]HRZ11411.1 hypothetical protein [Kiritimatiellia bacterium]HSA17038.1 hypothetical protein [Kiritimatiellia bacterium]
MNRLWRSLAVGVLALLAGLATSCMTRQAVTRAVEGWYVPDPDQVLTVNGEWAMDGLHALFHVDDPPRDGTLYTNTAGDSLVFSRTNGIRVATIRGKNRQKTEYEFLGYGGPNRSAVIGVWWDVK